MPARLLLPLMLSLAALAAAPAGAGAAGWLPAAPISPAGSTVFNADVAMDGAGNVYAAWIASGNPNHVLVSKRPVGGVFEEPQILDPAAPAGSTIQGPPDIAADGAGNAIVVWTRINGAERLIQTSTRLAGDPGFNSAPESVGDTTVQKGPAAVAVNPAGAVVLTWKDSGASTTPRVRAFRGTVVNGFPVGAGGPATYEGTSFTPQDPQPAINEAGDAAVGWVGTFSPPNDEIHFAFSARNTAFGGAATAVPGANNDITQSTARPAIDTQGDVTFVWTETDNTNDFVQSNTRVGSFGALATSIEAPAAAGDFSNAFAAYSIDERVAFYTFSGAVKGARAGVQTGPWNSVQELTGDEGAGETDSGSWPGGTVGYIWNATAASSEARAIVKAPGAGFGPASRVSAAGHLVDQPAIAFGGNGNGAGIWVDSEGGGRIASAVYDSTNPSFGSVDVPANGTAGQPVSVFATASDDWAIPTIHWDFGDGTLVPGGPAGAQHTYAAPGTYTVKATASDAAGNFTSESHTINVAPAQAPPPPPPPPPGIDPPVIGQSFNAEPVKGKVLVSVPKGSGAAKLMRSGPHTAAALTPPAGFTRFVPLEEAKNIPIGSLVDASKGTVQLTMAANKASTVTQTGQFSKGAFKTSQTRKQALTTVTLKGRQNFRLGCRTTKSKPARTARRRPRRQLFSNVHGRFRTRGRHSTATVRGTRYLVKDSCSGTLTLVRQGTVVVRDLEKHKSRTLKAGQRYLARPLKKRKRRR